MWVLRMAWRSSGRDNASLVEELTRNGLVSSRRVQRAMLAVDRGYFCAHQPYQDSPQSIGLSLSLSVFVCVCVCSCVVVVVVVVVVVGVDHPLVGSVE